MSIFSSDPGAEYYATVDPLHRLQGLEDSGKERDSRKQDAEENAKLFMMATKIQSIRRALRLTQTEFAEQYEFPLDSLVLWESAKQMPDQKSLKRLAALAALI